MSFSKPVFFQSDRLPRWRSALLVGWAWFRLRFRANPGFITAAVSGTIGLVLALILLLGVGWNRPEKGLPDEHQLAQSDSPRLGSGSELPQAPRRAGESSFDLGSDSDVDDLNDEPFTEPARASRSIRQARPIAKPSPRERVDDEHFLADDDSQSPESIETGDDDDEIDTSPAARVTMQLHDDDSLDEREEGRVEESDDEMQVADTKSGRLSFGVGADGKAGVISHIELDEENFDRDSRSTRVPFADVPFADDPAKEEAQPEQVEQPVAAKPAELAEDDEEEADESTLPAKPSPAVVRSRGQTTVSDDVSEEEVAADEQPFAEPKAQPKAGWKNTPSRIPGASAEPPGHSVEQSRAVETAVYAAPAEKPQPAPRKVENSAPVADPLVGVTLTVIGPEAIAAGQKFDLEFLVTNSGRSTLERAILSATLPEGLTHPLGPEVEHTVPSLRPGQTHRVRLNVEATSGGETVTRADIALQGKVAAKSTVRIHVTGARSRPSRSAPR